MLHETVLFDTSPDKCSVLMMCHASLCQQVLFLRVNQKASGIFSHLFMQVPLLKEGLLYPSKIAFESNSVSNEEHDKVRAVGCSEKVSWLPSCLHRCSANVILLSLGALCPPWDKAGFQLCHQRRTPQLISATVACAEGLHGWNSRAEVVRQQKKNGHSGTIMHVLIEEQLQVNQNVFKHQAGCYFGALETLQVPSEEAMSLMFMHVLSLFHFVFTMHVLP